jgi:hypothetical protein
MAVNNPTDLRPLIKAMNEFRKAVDLRATRIEARAWAPTIARPGAL